MPENKQTKILLVTGDDFGYCESINEGIVEAYHRGVLRNVSVMATGDGFDHAVKQLQNNPGVSTGIHVTLVASRPVTDPGVIPSLCGKDGNLMPHFSVFALKFFSGRIAYDHLVKEIRAQIDKVINTGIQPTHIDSHQHLHILPFIWRLFVQLAKEYSIPFIRVPYEDTRYMVSSNARVKQLLKYWITLPVLASRKTASTKQQVKSCDWFHGLTVSGNLDQDNIISIMHNIQPGLNELMCHPGYPPPAGDPAHSWGYNWDKEVKALTSTRTESVIEEESIVVKGYREIIDS